MRHAGGLAFSLFVIAGSVSASAAPLPSPDRYSSYPSHSHFEVDLRFFHDQLSPYGDWLNEPDWGPVWVPRRVSSGWRPYTMGHWAWTDDYGWLWVSDEPYGWATYHYGRWYPSSRYGWVWVPGYDWSPAWVTFRSGGGYYGWAPLPPEFAWDSSAGFRVGDVGFDVGLDRYVSPRSYTFVQDRWFLDPVVRHVVPVNRNDGILVETRNVTDYGVANSVPVNRGIAVERVQSVVGRPVPRERVVDVDTVAAARQRAPASGAVSVFRPAVSGARETIATRGAAVVERRPAPQVIEQRRQEDARRNVQRGQQADQQRQAQPPQAQQPQAQQRETQQQAQQRQAQERAARQQEAQHQREQQAQTERQRAQQAQTERQHAQQQAQAERRQAQQPPQAERQHAQQHAQEQQRAQQAQQSREQQLAQERQQAQARQAEARQAEAHQRQQQQQAQQQRNEEMRQQQQKAQQQRDEQARQKREQQQKKKPAKPNPNDNSKENQN